MTDDTYTEQLWKVQLEIAKLVQMMEELRLTNLCMQVVGKEAEWTVFLAHTPDHADDERRASHGN